MPDAVDYVFVRPNGKPYRPRNSKLRARGWENHGGWGNESQGVIVFGTLNPEEASLLAWTSCNAWYGDADSYGLASATPGWWRDGFALEGRTWIEDAERGAPGVMFTWDELDMSQMNWCGFCLIPVQTGLEPPHQPNCPTL